ncbi:MAG: AraC family transcriptional regulator [Burkholderiales bacterium]
MSMPIRFFEGRYGRVSLLGAREHCQAQAEGGPLIFAKHQGPDCEYAVGGEAQACKEDSLVLVNPGQTHGCACAPEDPLPMLLSVRLAQPWAQERFPAVFAESGRPFTRPQEEITPRIRRLFDALAVEMLNDQFLATERLEFMVQELTLSVVDAYVARRRAASPAWEGSRFADSRIRDAIALLRARPNKELNMDVVAGKVGLSRSRFYDLFQSCTGLSPRDYLDKLCVETAISRLAARGAKIADVSADLGFSAQSNFTRFFLNQVGIPPSEYRRAAQREARGT